MKSLFAQLGIVANGASLRSPVRLLDRVLTHAAARAVKVQWNRIDRRYGHPDLASNWV
jgi:hypothetical protein